MSNGAKTLPWQNTVYFSLLVASAAVPSKGVVLLLIHFIIAPIVCVVFKFGLFCNTNQ